MIQSDIRILCLLSLHRALLGKVFMKLRLGALSIVGKIIEVRWVVEGPLSDDEDELLSEVETELLSDLPDDYRVSTKLIHELDVPKDAELFFKRYEPAPGSQARWCRKLSLR